MTRLEREEIALAQLHSRVIELLHDGFRLGTISSIDGGQLVVLFLQPSSGSTRLLVSEVPNGTYASLTATSHAAHWFERILKDYFGIEPKGHPRLRSAFVPAALPKGVYPLRSISEVNADSSPVDFGFLKVKGHGVYELPVGPVHAGIIEPGHFRLSCLGEVIENLELRFGFLHRGIEQRITRVPWRVARFVAESASSDTSVANAIAHALALESMIGVKVPSRAEYLRTIALEIERVAMHLFDLGGMATDLGLLGVASNYARLRGSALRMAEILSGSRFMRGFVAPGGVVFDPSERLALLGGEIEKLQESSSKLSAMFFQNSEVQQRLSGLGIVSQSLASDFGLVGVAGRASGIDYDCRRHFACGLYPLMAPNVVVDSAGDVLARIRIRKDEVSESLALLSELCASTPGGAIEVELPETLPPSSQSIGVVESFRGELIHLAFTDSNGLLSRYVIKDPSINNWTGMAIAARGNLIADFPVCNKSFALSYSGHDL